jgi:hypothetical protein
MRHFSSEPYYRSYGNIVYLVLIFFSIILLLQSCANAVAPTGGAPDKTPPQILASEPIQRALNVHPTGISLLFNTFIAQRERVQQSIFLTPPVKTEYSWFGKTLYIAFKEPLDSNTTVALTLGTEYTNWDGNKPEAAYTLTFSTGAKLDSGTIRGTIDQQNSTDKRDGISAFLYPLTGIKPDTLNPITTKPKYKTQIGSKGTFEFPALARGAYRVFVVRDEFRNDVIDVGTDAFGTTTRDISLPEGATAEVRVQLAPKTDALPPQLYEVRHISPKRLVVRFNEKIEAASLRASAWTLRDSVRSLPAIALPRITQLHAETNNPAATVIYLDKPLETSLFQAATRWELRAAMVRDSAGNTISDSANAGFFSINTTPAQTDTTAPVLVRTVLANAPLAQRFFANAPALLDSARGLPLQPQIAFLFSSALQINTTNASIEASIVEKNIVFENTLQQAIPIRVVPNEQANMLLVEPRAPLQPNAWYSLGFRTSAVKAWNGAVPANDSVVVLRFQTSDPRDYGAVSGTLLDSALILPTTATIRLNASNDGVLATMASIRTTRATTALVETRAVLTTNGQYVIILEASQNLAPQAQPSPNASPASKGAPNQVPPTQGASNQASSPSQQSPFAQRRFERIVKKIGEWNFAEIPPGTYVLSVFYDANGNGKYDFGAVFPYSGAERFHAHPTEIQVRARWTVENVEVKLP